MIGLTFRIVLGCVLLVAAWKALGLYALYRYAGHMRHCLAESNTCQLAAGTGRTSELALSIAGDVSCVRRRQPWYEVVAMRTPRDGPGPAVSATDVEELERSRGWVRDMCGEWGRRLPGGR